MSATPEPVDKPSVAERLLLNDRRILRRIDRLSMLLMGVDGKGGLQAQVRDHGQELDQLRHQVTRMEESLSQSEAVRAALDAANKQRAKMLPVWIGLAVTIGGAAVAIIQYMISNAR